MEPAVGNDRTCILRGAGLRNNAYLVFREVNITGKGDLGLVEALDLGNLRFVGDR